VLRDGSEVLVRQVHRDDVPLLADGFARFGAESRKLRFLTDKTHLSPAELHYLTEIDHHDHEAIGALDAADGRGLGVARFIRDEDDPEVAEIAVAVVDDWQGRGLGTELLSRLVDRAHEEGISTFTALVASDNEVVAGLLHDVGGEVRATDGGAGVVEYMLTPAPEAHGRELHDLLRAFGRRQLSPPTPVRGALAALVPERFHS
jgi:RimJ/RimL family protein N-acetyltransferase